MAFEAFLMNFLANVASDIVGVTVKSLYEKIMDFKDSRDNYHHFRDMLDVMESHLNEIQSSSSQRHAEFSPAVESCIKRLISILRDAKSLIPAAPPGLFRILTIHTSIENAKRRLEAGFKDLDSILARQDQMNKMALLQPPVPLMQPEPQTGFVGDVIKDLEEKVLKLLHKDNPAQIIVVYGMGGVGKTTLIHKVYNSVIKENSVFQFSSQKWLTISQEYEVAKLQRTLSTNAGMQARDTEDEEGLKMRLAECFKTRKFFVVLDDVWSEDFDIRKLGLVFGKENHGSKVVITTRNRGVARKMVLAKVTEYVEVPTLKEKDAWEMFRLWSFGSLEDKDMHAYSLSAEQLKTAELVCKECKGLPLAIKVVSVSFPKDDSLSEQQHFLTRLRRIDPLFAQSEQKELFTKLKLSYDLLPTQELKKCFLYTACMFAEDEEIDAGRLIRMWICEGFLKGTAIGCEDEYYFSMQVGIGYLKHYLFYRCLISISGDSVFITNHSFLDSARIHVHDCIRDMALMVGRGETHSYAFASNISGNGDFKRLSLHKSDICELPSEFPHPDMISLSLSETKINKVPNGFFTQLWSLKVLDLSRSSVRSLPSSIRNLSSLELLDLSRCYYIASLPDELCSLPNLRVLDIQDTKIETLPSMIGNLTTLKEFLICDIEHVPKSLSCLTSLEVLGITLSQNEGPSEAELFDLKDLTGFRKLQNLYLHCSDIQCHESKEIEIDCECWSQMKSLYFRVSGEIVKIPEVFSKIIENMVQLENLTLHNCGSFLLPGNVSNVQSLTVRGISKVPCLGNFLNLKQLAIMECTIEALEICKTIQEIFLRRCQKLEQLVWPDDYCALKKLFLYECEDLKSMGIGKDTHLKCLEVVKLRKLTSLEEFGEEQDRWNRDKFPALRTFEIENSRSSEACMRRLEDLRRKILS